MVTKPGRSRRYHVSPDAARDITALFVLDRTSSAPSSSASAAPDADASPAPWTRIYRDYETLRIGMQTLFHDLGITTDPIPDAVAA